MYQRLVHCTKNVLVYNFYGTLVTLIHIISNNNNINPYKFKLHFWCNAPLHQSWVHTFYDTLVTLILLICTNNNVNPYYLK